ncbi:hypothetical protein C823_007471 [Eubacterium plexicaudatum ASF492]|nr:hypothetical protein C823_007471 [Eubacterium plexicaudatum ASF492]
MGMDTGIAGRVLNNTRYTFRRNGYVTWPLPHVAFALRQHGSSGGGAYILRMAGREELLCFYRKSDCDCTETTLCEEECMELLTPHVAGTCDKMIVTGQTADSTDRLIGMSYGLFSHKEMAILICHWTESRS